MMSPGPRSTTLCPGCLYRNTNTHLGGPGKGGGRHVVWGAGAARRESSDGARGRGACVHNRGVDVGSSSVLRIPVLGSRIVVLVRVFPSAPAVASLMADSRVTVAAAETWARTHLGVSGTTSLPLITFHVSRTTCVRATTPPRDSAHSRSVRPPQPYQGCGRLTQV